MQPTAAGLRPYAYNVSFAPTVSGNPFASDARYTGVLNDMGTRDNDIRSDTGRLVGGVKYTLGSWDLESALTYSKNKVTANNMNRISLNGTAALFNVATTPQPPVPRSTSSQYNLDNPALNSQALRDSFRINFPRQSTSELSGFDTKGTTELGIKLPGGNVGLAVGVETRKEELKDRPDPRAQAGQVLGQGITATDGSRTSSAVYAELGLPIFKQLEMQLAARYDRYSDYGSSTNPKIGLKYTPTDTIALRANYGKGFRAPTLPEISPSVATFFTSVIDPQNGASTQISGVFAGNPQLKAEKSNSASLGIVFEPVKDASVSVDYFRINWRDVVASPSLQSIINASCPSGPPCPSTATVVRDPANNNAVVTVLSNYQNLASRVTSGFDVDGRMKFPTATAGTFTARLNATYINSFTENDVEVVGTNAGVNTIPRVKAALSLDWDQGPFSVTSRANYTHSFYQKALAASYFTTQDPRFQTDVYPDRAGSVTTFDLFGRYQITKNLTISGSVLNVLNKLPPYDPGFSTTSFYDFSLYGPLGRRFSIALNYKM